MLEVHRTLGGKRPGKRSIDSRSGDYADLFLRDVLVEVAAENYRQMMYEVFSLKSEGEAKLLSLDPPLRANERVISGLFANAISRVAPRSRPEARIDRGDFTDLNEDPTAEDRDEQPGQKAKAGRVDYLAWYASSVVGVELKAVSLNCERPKITASAQKRWKKVVEQARTTQDSLLERSNDDPHRYPNPVSLALMTIVGRRMKDSAAEAPNDLVETWKTAFVKKCAELDETAFLATYTFPSEFRNFVPRRRGNLVIDSPKASFTPFVAFLASVAR